MCGVQREGFGRDSPGGEKWLQLLKDFSKPHRMCFRSWSTCVEPCIATLNSGWICL